MCVGCRSSIQGASDALGPAPFGTAADGSEGHGGIANKEGGLDGAGEVTKKYGEALDPTSKTEEDSKEAEYTGHGE